jgi:hypothetical protein
MRNFLKTALIVALFISVGANVFMYQRYRNRRVYMTINNHPITQQDIYDRLIQQSGEPVKVQLTQSHLLDDEAEKEKLVPTDAEIQEQFDQQREANWQFARKMTQNPWFEIEAKNEIRQNLELRRLLTAKVPVTEDQIKEEYAVQPAAFDTPDKAYCYLALIHNNSDNLDNIQELMKKGISTDSIQQNYPNDVTFLGDNTASIDGKTTTNLFIFRQPFGSLQNPQMIQNSQMQQIFKMKPSEITVLPAGEFASQGIKNWIVRMVKGEPGHKADLSDPKTHEQIRMVVAGKRATNPKQYMFKLWQAADFRSEDPNDKKYIDSMLRDQTK